MDRFKKLRISLRYYLQGAADRDSAYLLPLRAFEFAMQHHVGTRKDGVTPEFIHQIETTLFLRTLLKSVRYPAETLAAMLLHDVEEDYGASVEEFGVLVAHGVWRMTKKARGIKKSNEQYFTEMLDCPIATLCKGADRIHNQQSMLGVFSRDKQLEYLAETRDYILPMLKAARRRYPDQENAYANIEFVLRAQVRLLSAINHIEMSH